MTITADFSGGEKTATTEPLYQWDTGQKLALSGLPQTASDIQVHFANAAMAQAVVKATELVGSLPTCDIPNEFLQFGSAAKARAWVFYRTSNTEGYTVRTVLIPVIPRKRPNDYVSPEDPDSKGIVERAMELLENYQSDLDSKLDDSDGSVKTANLDSGAVTEAKLAQAVKDIINAKEVKSNKKTTLTGNENSDEFYPTTKAVADALSTKAPSSTAYTFDSTTTNVVYNTANPKTIYLNATVDDETGIVITAKDNDFQYFLGRSGTLKIRYFSGGTSYSNWAQVTEHVDNKKNSITSSNRTSTDFYPSIKAVVDYLAANYEDLSNKLTSEAGIDGDSTDTEYPTAKAVFDLGMQIVDDVAGDLVLKENLSNKKNAIAGNETSEQYYPSIKAVVDYLVANYEVLSNKLTSEEGIDSDSTDTQYPTAKAVYDLGVEILALVNDDISNVESRLVLKESSSNKQSSITAANKASTALYPSIKAVVDYLVANYLGSGDSTVKTENLDDESITVEKVADDLAAVINAKEEKSNKKTTLTGNENSDEFYPTTKAVADALNTNNEVVTDVIYSDEDLSEYSSVNSTSGMNQACVVIAPNEVDPYFLKSAQVKTKAGTPVKFSVFGISRFYPQDPYNQHQKRFTKVKDLVVINADDDGVARIEFDLPMPLIPDETVLVASCDTSQSSFFYGPYKDAQHTIFNYNFSWFDLQPGESGSRPFPYKTSENSPYFVLEYVLASNATEIKKSAAEILQEQEYLSPYDNFVSDTSTNAVQNNAIYPFIISKDENVVNDEETTYLSAGKYNVDNMSQCFAISCEAPTYGTYSVSSIEVRATNDAVITFGLWEMRFTQNRRGYWNLKQVLGTVTAANTRAKLTFQTPIVVDSSNQVIIATCPEKKIAWRSAATSPNPWKRNRVTNSVFWRDNNSFSNAQVGDEVNLLVYNLGYRGWDYRGNDPNVGAYEITYTPTVPEILTETRTLETCVNGLLSPIGSLRNKVWYCAGDSTTFGIEEGRSYAQIIAERNGMELWKDGISGSTMTSYPDAKLFMAFSFDRYLNIPENVDFVTLWFGINDSHMGYPVGKLDSDDPATFCGAYNKVLTWIINNRPNARVGLVVTHFAKDSIKNAIRNLAKKYGFLVFDLQTDPRIPFWHPTDSYYANDVDAAVKTLRASQWWYADSVHPLTAGYEAISYPFESWLRSL